MIDDIEISPSNRAKCSNCSKKIGKGVPRGIRLESQSYGHSKKYFCYKCSLVLIDLGTDVLKDMRTELNKLIKDKKEVITKNEIIENLEDKNG